MRLHFKHLILPPTPHLSTIEGKSMQTLFLGQGALDSRVWICLTWALFRSISFTVPVTLDFLQSMDWNLCLRRLTPLPIQVFSIGASVTRRREGGMNSGPETSTEHPYLIVQPWIHCFPVALGEKDSTALPLPQPPALTQTPLVKGPPLATSHSISHNLKN